MKIRARTIVAGPKVSIKAGGVAEVDDDFGQELIDGGYAEKVSESESAAPSEKGTSGNESGTDYSELKKAELEVLCIERDIEFAKNANKGDLIALLEKADGKPTTSGVSQVNYSELNTNELENLCIERDIEFEEDSKDVVLIDLLETADSKQEE